MEKLGEFAASSPVYETAATRLWDELQTDLSWDADMLVARKKNIISFYTAKHKKADDSTSRLVAKEIDSPGSESFMPDEDDGNGGEEEIRENDETESPLSTEDVW